MNGFERVLLKTHVFGLDFDNEGEAVSFASFVRTSVVVSGIVPVRFYNVDGDTYVYCKDKLLRKQSNNAFISTGFMSDVAPLVIPILKNGEKALLFVSDTIAKTGGETVSDIPYGTSYAFCGGRLFITAENKIMYSEEFDFTDFSVGLTFGGFIALSVTDGEALFVAEDAGNLYVIAEHAVYRISPYGEQFEFSAEKISTFRLNVKKNTVYQTGNIVCFISGNDFCVLSGGKVKRAGDALSAFSAYSYGVAGGTDELYVLPLSSGGKKYAYVYDVVREKEFLKEADGFTVVGAYALKENDVRLYAMTTGMGKATLGAYSAEYDFGSCAEKSVCAIEAHITGSADIVVSGDGTFRATLTEKCNAASCFVHGRTFTVSFENASADFKPHKLAIRYVIHGE